MLLRNKKNIQTTEDLKQSYNNLYSGWMKDVDTSQQAEYMLKLLSPHPGASLLDAACGTGKLVTLALRFGLDPVGIDISEKAIGLAKDRYPDQHDRFICGDAESLPWEDSSFDYITNLGILEHYMNPEAGCREMARVLKKDGKAVILLPNSHDLETIYKVYKTGEGPDDWQDFERFATRNEWVSLLENNGMKVIDTKKYDLP
ncbi:MAG: class I SAM-dependent methyltransferase, partial [Desulfobacteraceae bacterium]